MDMESIAIVISLVVSALSFIVSWCAFRLSRRVFERDRSDLRLRVEYYHETGLGSAFLVILVNHGRRPITVEKVQLHLKSGEMWSYVDLSSRNANLPPKLPAVLQETESCDFMFPLWNGKEIIDTPLEIKRVEAYDTLGQRYSFPTRKIKSQIDFFKLKWQIARSWRAHRSAFQGNNQ